MNVLVVHNRYREPGGEDRVVELETSLLARHGHTVVPYVLDNASIDGMNPIALAGRTIWSQRAYRDVGRLIADEQIDLVHVHNTLPLVSPSVYHAAAAARVPVVQTLHNYRMLCPSAVLVRDGKPCMSCVGATPFPAIRHACYRGSRTATATVAAMLVVHRAAGTWQRAVDTYIAPTEFARGMFVTGGLPAARIVVKPHFVDPDPGVGTGRGGYALYVGRLSPEKGVGTLLDAWAQLGLRVPLTIAGDGPLAPSVKAAAARLEGVTYLGQQSRPEVQALMAEAAVLVFPSIFYETFGQVVVEAYAVGTPVLTTAGGAAAELVSPGRTGVLVPAGDAADLARVVERLFSDDAALRSMRGPARAAYEARFTADANYQQLMAIYGQTRSRVASGAAHTAPASLLDAVATSEEARS